MNNDKSLLTLFNTVSEKESTVLKIQIDTSSNLPII